MTEMVERVARAYRAKLLEFDPSILNDINEPIDPAELELARAALESLRLPTHEMLEAANAAGSPESPALPHEVWPAMIDAAIGKGQ